MRKIHHSHPVILLCAINFVVSAQNALASSEVPCVGFTAADTPRYDVRCKDNAESAAECEVDAGTYRGFETYRDNCARCHGHGTGVSVSPAADLTRRRIDYEALHLTIYHGHEENIGVMPSWKENCEVIPRIGELYLYLRARSDGVLPPGQPSAPSSTQ